MEKTINTRIKELIAYLKTSNNAFAKSISKTSTTINQITMGKSKPGFEVLEAICETYPAVNPTWLLRGEGEMYLTSESVSNIEKAPDQYLQDHVKQLESSFTQLAQQLAVKDRQIDGLQRTVDALLTGKPEPATNMSKVIEFRPVVTKASCA